MAGYLKNDKATAEAFDQARLPILILKNDDRLSNIDCQSKIADRQFLIGDSRSTTNDWRLPIDGYRMTITDWRLSIDDYRMAITDGRLPIDDH